MNPAQGPHLSHDDFDAWTSGASLSAQVRDHLAGCPECLERAEAEREVVALISALAPMAPAPDFADRVMQSVSVPDPFSLRSLAGIHRRLFATPRAAALAATLALLVVGSMTASVMWSLGHPEALAALGSWIRSEAWQAGWIAVRGLASNVIEQPWYSGLRQSLDHPARWGAGSAFVSLLYAGGILAMRRLMSDPARQVSHANV